MSNPVAIYRRQTYQDNPDGAGIWLWCPGCDCAHRPQVKDENGNAPSGPCWEWNGDVENLTISPSLLVTLSDDKKCHSFIRDGHWEFLLDSFHDLKGQTVPLPPLPDWLVR